MTHWIWAISFFCFVDVLQIFNARTTLFVGKQSGFQFDNSVLSIGADDTRAGPVGRTVVLGKTLDTDGVLGASVQDGEKTERGFPFWATLPRSIDLATARVIHFFFAWLLVGTLLVWLAASPVNRHLLEVIPRSADFRSLPRDFVEHLSFRFDSGHGYNVLQKITYAIVLLVLFPLKVATGLTMSPAIDAFAPGLLDVFGGRQTARTIHFCVMASLVLFATIHLAMVLSAGPFNEMRSMITGWYRTRATSPVGAPKRRAECRSPADV